jgi:hypothetical protein
MFAGINVAACLAAGIPLAYVFSIVSEGGLGGLWAGYGVGAAVAAASEAVVLHLPSLLDWSQVRTSTRMHDVASAYGRNLCIY